MSADEPTSDREAPSEAAPLAIVEGPALAPRRRYTPIVYEPSPLWRWIYDRFFSHVAVGDDWATRIREDAARAQIVYVGRSLSFLDFLALDYLTKKHDLPRVQFCNDVGMSVVEPFGRGAARLRLERPTPDDQAFVETMQRGASALLFLRRPPDFAANPHRGRRLEHDLVRSLVELQRKSSKPFLLCPQSFVWTKRPPNRRATAIDLLFGPSEWPGKIRTVLQFAVNHRNALVRSSEPLDIAQFLAEHQDMTDAQAASAIRLALLRRMERERATVLGPAQKPVTRIMDEVLRSPRLKKHLEQASRETHQPMPTVLRHARKDLEQLCAAPEPTLTELFHRVLERVWTRIYDGVEVDREGLERVRAAAQKGPLVFVPSHKSHVDYLVMSDRLHAHGIAAPLIAAGDNLSFFPLGPLLRRSGAFFIRRSFKGQKLYPHLVDAYIRKVLAEGHNIEVFIEGGRSRTGKLLPPKLGILSMLVDAALKITDRAVQFVPISIGYERVIEERSYLRELEGGDKKAEDLGGLLRSPRVLRSKYGRLYIEFGEILSLEETRREAKGGHPDDGTLSPSERRNVVQRLAHRITYEIDRVTVVTPAALVATELLTYRRRGIAQRDLLERCRESLRWLEQLGARIAPPLRDADGGLRPDAIEETLRLFFDAKLVVTTTPTETDRILSVPDVRRIALEYFKNNIIHFFVASAMVASCLAALDWDTPVDALKRRVHELSRLFKLEFMYRADAGYDAIFADALARMVEAGLVLWDGDRVRAAGGAEGRRLQAHAEMLRTYFEAYRHTVRSLRDLSAPVAKKDWVKQVLVSGRRAYAAGEIELRETLSRPKFENALASLHDLGRIRVESEQVLPRDGAGESPKAGLDALDALLTEHLTA